MSLTLRTIQAEDIFDRMGRGELTDVVKHLRPLHPSSTNKTAVITGGGFGAGLVPAQAAAFVIELTAEYGAYKTLNVREAGSGKTTFPIATNPPRAAWISPGNMGSKLTSDGALVGGGIATESRELGALIDVAIPLLEDAKADLSIVLPDLLARAFAAAIDWACFSADGTDDDTDGQQTGIFAHAGVPSVSAAATHYSVQTLLEDDMLRTVDACDDAALTRNPRWWMHPAIYKKLLGLHDGSGAALIKFESGQPYIVGYPVTLVTGAPSANAVGSKVIAFGAGEAYLVAIRSEMTVLASDVPKFNYNIRQFRGITRVRCQMLNASWFSTLKLAVA
jgi:HK97 family phage major capsid protein